MPEAPLEVTMNCSHEEPSLSDALSDPIIQTIMTADHVDPQALEASLRETAQRVGRRRAASEG